MHHKVISLALAVEMLANKVGSLSIYSSRLVILCYDSIASNHLPHVLALHCQCRPFPCHYRRLPCWRGSWP